VDGMQGGRATVAVVKKIERFELLGGDVWNEGRDLDLVRSARSEIRLGFGECVERFEWIHTHAATTRTARSATSGKRLRVGLCDDEAVVLKHGGGYVVGLVRFLVNAFMVAGNAVARGV
jgi:hypothetical protein